MPMTIHELQSDLDALRFAKKMLKNSGEWRGDHAVDRCVGLFFHNSYADFEKAMLKDELLHEKMLRLAVNHIEWGSK